MAKKKSGYSVKLAAPVLSVPVNSLAVAKPKKSKMKMAKAKVVKRKSKIDGGWLVSFADGKTVMTGYYPNPRMAVAEALKEHKGKVKSVKYV